MKVKMTDTTKRAIREQIPLLLILICPDIFTLTKYAKHPKKVSRLEQLELDNSIFYISIQCETDILVTFLAQTVFSQYLQRS